MDRDQVFELQRANLEAFIRTLAHASAGRVAELDGVVAAVAPACAERSIANSVIWSDVGSLRAGLGDLARIYEAEGIRAWTVWVPEHEREAAGALEAAGHHLDASPAAMYLELGDLESPRLGDLDWDANASAAEAGRVNDLAYGYPAGEGISAGVGHGPPGLPTRLYRARAEGEVATVLETIDTGSDCAVVAVATLPEHRGKGLAGRLLAAALGEARERGLRTSTLQASMLGRGVYERVGYRVGGRLQMYERRQ
jgi:GNAT superfamily N-acetyltransferase